MLRAMLGLSALWAIAQVAGTVTVSIPLERKVSGTMEKVMWLMMIKVRKMEGFYSGNMGEHGGFSGKSRIFGAD